MNEHTKLPWPDPVYDNDTGPDDENFWEWYSIEGIAKFDSKDDAELAVKCVNKMPILIAALKEIAAMGDYDTGAHSIARKALSEVL